MAGEALSSELTTRQAWGKRGELILQDSNNVVLVSLDPETGNEVELWQVIL
jgi:regulator of extracellular matrix RemA (YlzA/DUF370 family)